MDEHVRILKELPLWSSEITIKPLSGGITNFNYLVQDGEKKYVGRFASKSNTLLGLDREREVHNTGIAFSLGIGPKVTQFFPEHNLLVVEYIEGDVFTPEIARQPEHIRALAQLLKKLHGGPTFNGTFDPFKTIRTYVATAKQHGSWLPDDIDILLSELSQVQKDLGEFYATYPCHLDLMVQNVVGTKNGVTLLDWEYSSNSDCRFDLAMLSVSGAFTEADDNLLLEAYGNDDADLYDQIRRMKAVVCFREASWGMLQLAISKIEFDYKKYTVEHLDLFRSFAANAK